MENLDIFSFSLCRKLPFYMWKIKSFWCYAVFRVKLVTLGIVQYDVGIVVKARRNIYSICIMMVHCYRDLCKQEYVWNFHYAIFMYMHHHRQQRMRDVIVILQLNLYVLNTKTSIYILCHFSTLIWHRYLKFFKTRRSQGIRKNGVDHVELN